ncbi:MAG: hypothetical protein WBP79_00090, partial [Candidatus Acidiferrales bacterium]
MTRRFAAIAVLALAFWQLGSAQSRPSSDVLVFERPSNKWFEGPLTFVTVSNDASEALFNLFGREVNLYSLATKRDEKKTLQGDLDDVRAAAFCGPGKLARFGRRGTEKGVFLKKGDSLQLLALPPDAVAVCSPDGSEVAYYSVGSPEQGIFISRRGEVRNYGVTGTITAMAFSPDGEMFYDLLFQPNGESALVRINVHTSAARTIASHLDASPMMDTIAISPDGRHAYLALAGAGPPKNEERHHPFADRWLKIYELDLTNGARHAVVVTPDEDNNNPAVAGGNLYWTRTVVKDAIVVVPVKGGDAKEVMAGGELPMWHPAGNRIAYTFGGWRLADWALNLDDAVVNVDSEAERASVPSLIVAGYHEDFPPAWSPDGRWIAYHSHRSSTPVPSYSSPASTDDIYLRRAEELRAPEIRLTNFGWETGPAYWSPDGKKLLFTSWDRAGQPGIDKLWIITVDTEAGQALQAEKLQLPAEIHSAQWGAWSPDGKEIAVEDRREGQIRAIWIVAAGGGSHAEKILEYEGTTYGGLDWSQDGKSIIYSGLAGDRLQLFSVPRAGGAPVQLTNDSGNLLHPRVSPDGRWIACTRLVQS